MLRFLKQNFVEIHRKDDQDDKLGSFVTDARTHKIYYPRELGTSVSTAHQNYPRELGTSVSTAHQNCPRELGTSVSTAHQNGRTRFIS